MVSLKTKIIVGTAKIQDNSRDTNKRSRKYDAVKGK